MLMCGGVHADGDGDGVGWGGWANNAMLWALSPLTGQMT